jgi:hypothetical protein
MVRRGRNIAPKGVSNNLTAGGRHFQMVSHALKAEPFLVRAIKASYCITTYQG